VARDFSGKEPKFAATCAVRGHAFAHGGGYDPPVSDVNEAVKHLFAAARQVGAVGWPNRNLADWLHLHAFPAARYSSKP